MQILRENGEREEFQEEILRNSLLRAGADDAMADHIVAHILEELVEGMTTTDIYHHAFALLKKGSDKPIAARYSLKRAVMGLGPAGFAFESLLAEIFKAKGFTTETGVHLNGKCAEHEIDLLAYKNRELLVAEAKFHNRPGFKTDLKVVLYVEARWRDLSATEFGGRAKDGTRGSFTLFTNTTFTNNAIRFANCAGLSIIGWTYPSRGNLEDLIEETGVHPVTCLTTLTHDEKQGLFREGIVLCRDIKGNMEKLRSMGLDTPRAHAVLSEANLVCVPEHQPFPQVHH